MYAPFLLYAKGGAVQLKEKDDFLWKGFYGIAI